MLQEVLKADPGLDGAKKDAVTQWVAAVVGAATVAAETGAATALDNVNYNYLTHEEALKKAEAERNLAACAARPGTCSDQQIRQWTDTVAELEARDSKTDQMALETCAFGSPLFCLRHLNRLEAIRQGFGAHALSPSDPDYKSVAAQFYADGALVSVLHSLVAYRDGRDLAEAMAPYDLGAVAGAGAAVAAFGAMGGARALTSVIGVCGKVNTCYLARLTQLLQELREALPELGGTGAGVVATERALTKAADGQPLRVVAGVELNSKLPDPVAGLEYVPKLLNDLRPNVANSHLNGYVNELKLANVIAGLPDQVVVRYGDAIGTNGADVVSVNRATGDVTLWDNKYRTALQNLKSPSKTFEPESSRLKSAVKQAEEAIEAASLPADIEAKALKKLDSGNYTTNTVGSGKLRNSISIRYCGHVPC